MPSQDRRALAQFLAPLALGFAAIVAIFLVAKDPAPTKHRLYVTVAEATNIIKGQELKAGGGKIGEIAGIRAIDGGKRARLAFDVEDRAWPLPKGTRFAIRFGGTASFYNRHVLVTPGKPNGTWLPDGGTIPAEDFRTPIEVDKLLALFDSETRSDLKTFVDRSGATFDRARRPFQGTLDKTPQALDQGARVIEDLVDDRGALDVTLSETSDVVNAVRRADPGLSRLIGGTASTFDAVAEKQTQLRVTLDRLPPMLAQTRETLGRAEQTLDGVGRLSRRIGPGVRQLRAVAGPLETVLTTVTGIAPDANAALSVARRAAPTVNAFLARATKVAPQIGSVFGKATTNLKCIRPYAPEIAALMTTWADFMSFTDGKDKILRAQVQNFLPAGYNDSPQTPEQLVKQNPGVRYGFPRPPGFNANQFWFQPECGAGPDALDPSKDREATVRGTPPPPMPGGRR